MDRISTKKRLELQYHLNFWGGKKLLFESQIHLDFKIDRLAITGPVASGKSSLLKIIAGILQPHCCRVVFDENIFTDTKQKKHTPIAKRKVGYLAQESFLFPHLNVHENLLFSPSAKDNPNLEKWINIFGVEQIFSKMPLEISGGERKKICLLQLLLSKPNLLLLDEPLTSLDKKSKYQFLEFIMQFQQDFNLPIIYITHSPEEINIFAKQRIYLKKGKVWKLTN